jgi:glucuronate isomerase
MGCRASDHGIEEPFADECTDEGAQRVFVSLRTGAVQEQGAARAFKAAVLRELGRMDSERGWVMQLHLGALRDINTRFMKKLGPNSGFDTTGDGDIARPLARFLDSLDREGRLPKTILYCLNPGDYPVLAAMTGSFPQENVRGKMQFGPAWWFNDQKHGMENQLQCLADVGLLPRFVGMLTDSRSFLSYPRHEYFRRILCEMLGGAMDRGEAPMDMKLMGGIVQDICCRNAQEYFGF